MNLRNLRTHQLPTNILHAARCQQPPGIAVDPEKSLDIRR